MGTAGRLTKGCGCGCALLLTLLGLLVWGGWVLIAQVVREAGEAEAVSAQVHETVGRVADYKPPPDGAVPAVLRITSKRAFSTCFDENSRTVLRLLHKLKSCSARSSCSPGGKERG